MAVLCALGSAATAQETGRIRGSVVDSTTSQPLFATVAVLSTPHGTNVPATGRFVIDGVPPGTYRVRATFIGYAPKEQAVTVTAGADVSVSFALVRLDAAGTTQKIVVTADKSLVDVSEVSTVRSASAQDISKLAVDEVGEIIQRQVGVAGENEEMHIRGGRTDETQIRLENVAMKNVVTGAQVGASLPAKAVENIEVITGGYEAEYGQAISGIVNVQLKEAGYEKRSAVEYHSGNNDLQRMFVQTEGALTPHDYPIPGRISYLIGFDMVVTDTYLPSRRNATHLGGTRRSLRSGVTNSFAGLTWQYDDIMRARQDNNFNLYTKFTWRMTPRHKVNATLTKYVALDHGFFRFRIGDEVSDASSSNTAYAWDYRDQMDQALTVTEETSVQSLNWRWTVNNDSYSTLVLSHFFNNQEEAVQGKRPWEEGQAYDSHTAPAATDTFFIADGNGDLPAYGNLFTDRWTAAAAYTRRWHNHHELRAGMESSYYTIQMISIGNPAEGESGGLGSVRDMYRVHPNDGAFFLQNKFAYEGFAGHIGMRADYLFLGEQADDAAANQGTTGQDYLNDTNELWGARYKIFFSPRLAVNHPITERDAMHFNFGHFVQWPRLIYYYSKISSNSSEAFPIEGNLNLDPERSVQFEFGVKHQFTDEDAIDITLFNKDTYDYPTATQPVEATRRRLVYVNSDFSRTRGLEFVYQHRGRGRVSGSLSYEYQIATGKPADPNRIRQVDPSALETGSAEPELNEEFMPWNRPHRIQAGFDVRARPNDRLRFLGMTLTDRWSASFFYSLYSGRPYTPTDNRGNRTGKRNSSNAPTEQSLDIKLNKYWQPSRDTMLNVRLEVRNVFDTAPLRTVDSATGQAPTLGEGRQCEGCLSSDASPEIIADRNANPAYYGAGRSFRLGFEVTF